MKWDYERGYRDGQKEALETVLRMIENQDESRDLNKTKESINFLMDIYENVHGMYSKNNPLK